MTLEDFFNKIENGDAVIMIEGGMDSLIEKIKRETKASFEGVHILPYIDTLGTSQAFFYFSDFSFSIHAAYSKDKGKCQSLYLSIEGGSSKLASMKILVTHTDEHRIGLLTDECFEAFMEQWLALDPLKDPQKTLRYTTDPKKRHALKSYIGTQEYIKRLFKA